MGGALLEYVGRCLGVAAGSAFRIVLYALMVKYSNYEDREVMRKRRGSDAEAMRKRCGSDTETILLVDSIGLIVL